MELQQQIKYNERTQQCSQTDTEESYADATLGMTPTLNAGECKILRVAWNSTSDRLILDLTELARLANCLQPNKKCRLSDCKVLRSFGNSCIGDNQLFFQKLC